MKAPSIYIIIARLARISGLKLSKMYEKLHSVLIWSLQKGTSCQCQKPHRSNLNQIIVYSLYFIIQDIYSLHLNCFNGVVPYKVRYTSAPNSHKCKRSPEKIQSQQPKGRQFLTDWIALELFSLSRKCYKPHRYNSNKRIAYSS